LLFIELLTAGVNDLTVTKMVDINSISAEGYEKIGIKAPPGGGSDERDASSFQSILLETQLQRLNAWSQAGGNASEPTNLFNEYRIILEQSRGQQTSESPSTTRPSIVNPNLVAKYYELEAARVSLGMETQSIGNSQPFSISDLAQLAGGVRGVPGSLFQQLIQNESAFNPNAIGSRGGLGLGQLLPGTAESLGLRIGGDRSEGSVWHPTSNLDGSARHLKALYDQFIERGVSVGEAWRFATGAYNTGVGDITQAMELLEGGDQKQWNRVAKELHRITGARAQETVDYVDRLK
jgi:soluble lytic murein transglycosylase-like protein